MGSVPSIKASRASRVFQATVFPIPRSSLTTGFHIHCTASPVFLDSSHRCSQYLNWNSLCSFLPIPMMKFITACSAVVTASLLAGSAAASYPTESKSLLSRGLPMTGGPDSPDLIATVTNSAITAMKTTPILHVMTPPGQPGAASDGTSSSVSEHPWSALDCISSRQQLTGFVKLGNIGRISFSGSRPHHAA